MSEGLVSFDEFQKMDLRVGRVVKVEDHPNADKLLVIQVDIGGGETRQTVAALKGHYTAEELMGKTAACICNLEPATLRGERSEAMVLAAQHGEQVVLIVPEQEMEPGSKIL